MADLLLEIASFLKSEGVITKVNTDTFLDSRPETPDAVISLQEYSGLGRLNGGVGAARSIQISVRSPKHDPLWAKNKAQEIFDVLCPPEMTIDTRDNIVPGTLWGVIVPRQTPFKIKIDENARTIYGFNISVITKED